MKTSLLKKIILISSIILLLLITIALTLLFESDNGFFDMLFNKEVNDLEQESQVVEENIKTLTIEDYENEYRKYIEPKENFIHLDNREKKDVFYFAGDVFFSNNVRKAYDSDGIDGILESTYLKMFESSDLCMANLECSITDNDENPADKTYTFNLPTKYVNGIKQTKIDLFTLANNHILDYGMDELNHTIKMLDENNISHIGAADNLYDAKKVFIKEIDGKRYAFFAASAVLPKDSWKADYEHGGVCNGYDIKSVVDEIKLIRPYFDKIIVYMHWGKELENESNDLQRTHARHIVDAGADLIIGTHSHTIQEIEYYKNVPIVYSLGNFIYGGQMRDMIVIEATFDYSKDKNGEVRLRVYPGVSNFQKTRRYYDEATVLSKITDLQIKSRNCQIAENGFVYTDEEVEKALNDMRSLAENVG